MPKFLFNKIIRHKLIDIMRQDNIDVVSNSLSPKNFNNALKIKLLEEVQEVITATKQSDIIEELADVLEVIYKLCDTNNISISDIEQAREIKKNAKGTFTPQSYINHVVVPDLPIFNFYLNYYRSAPDKYPETAE